MFERFSKEARAQKKLTAAFNNAAQMEEALTQLHKENPNFEFLKEENEKGAYFVTNIPLMRAGKTEDMTIDVTPEGNIVTVDPHRNDSGKEAYAYTFRSAKVAASHIKTYVNKRGLAS